MATQHHRYRITVTPIETDGLPCQRRCSVEFEQTSHDDWTRIIENIQRLRGLSGDERVALVVASKLFGGLMLAHRDDEDDLFTALRPHFGEFIRDLKQRAHEEALDTTPAAPHA